MRSSRSSSSLGRLVSRRARTIACPAWSYSPDGRAPDVLIGIVRADGTPVYGVATDMDGAAPPRVAHDRYAFALALPRIASCPAST